MKKLFVGAFLLLSSLAFADVAYVDGVAIGGGSTKWNLYSSGPSLDVATYAVFGNYYVRQICIGGGKCGRESSINVLYPAGTYLQKVVIRAHDSVGDSTNALLQLYVDGVFVNELDVKSGGSDLEYTIGRFVQNMQLKSINKNRGSGGDETAVSHILSY